MTNEEIAKTIRVIREKNFMTQDEFAKAIGVNKQAVWCWENGRKRPTLEHMKAIDRFRKKALQDSIDFKEQELKLTKLNRRVIKAENEVLCK